MFAFSRTLYLFPSCRGCAEPAALATTRPQGRGGEGERGPEPQQQGGHQPAGGGGAGEAGGGEGAGGGGGRPGQEEGAGRLPRQEDHRLREQDPKLLHPGQDLPILCLIQGRLTGMQI